MTAQRVGADNQPIGCVPGAAAVRCEASAEVARLLEASAGEFEEMECVVNELLDSVSNTGALDLWKATGVSHERLATVVAYVVV